MTFTDYAYAVAKYVSKLTPLKVELVKNMELFTYILYVDLNKDDMMCRFDLHDYFIADTFPMEAAKEIVKECYEN
jgi:hypothetical protein|nr:MAG TPA: hypothetical protein [Caudoviricetes sp.]